MRLRAALRPSVVRMHEWLAAVGIHVLPRHYYSSFADLAELRRTRAQWATASEMPGVRMCLDEQLDFLRTLSPYFVEISREALSRDLQRRLGEGIAWPDGLVLHAFVRHCRPRSVVEIGGGMSSFLIRSAMKQNGTAGSQHTVVEPYPTDFLKALEGITLVPKRLQEIGSDTFTSLGQSDFVFVDSTHTVKPGSDVNYIILELLPRLSPGVVVHFHDINFPYDYQPDLFQTLYQWSEGSLLRAYLTNNPKWDVLLSMSYLHHKSSQELVRLLPGYRPAPMTDGLFARPLNEVRGESWDFASSTYIRMRDGVST